MQTFENETEQLVHITINGEKISTTPKHPFYVPQKGWTCAIELKAGDILQMSNGEYVTVEQVQHEILEEPVKVYNFEVVDFHTYHVGVNSVLVHNDCDVDTIKKVAQKTFDYAVENPRKQGLSRMQLGKDAEVQATRWTRKWAERNGVELSEKGLHFQVRGAHSIPDLIYEPSKTLLDFKLTPKAIRKKQSNNFKNDFSGYDIGYIFGPGEWRD